MTQTLTKEVVEGVVSLPAAFGTTFFIRFFIPGLLVSIASIPLWPSSWTNHLDLSGLGVYLLGALSLGIILRGMMRLAEGALFMGWKLPRRFRNWLISRLQRRLLWAQKVLDEPFPTAYSSLDPLFWDKVRASVFIRMLPYMDERVPLGQPQTGKLQPTVTFPTMWGNVWTAFASDMDRCFPEEPSRRFGRPVHSISRATYAISPGARREIEELASYSEAALSVSVRLGVLALTYVWATIAHGNVVDLVMAAVSFLVCYLAYVLSVSELNGTLQAFRAAVLKEHPEPHA